MNSITREELLMSKEYWTTKLQMDLFAEIEAYMEAHQMSRSQLAKYLGCTKGYVSQLLSGDFDSRISKLVELSIAIGKVPEVSYTDIYKYMIPNDTFYYGEGSTKTNVIFAPVKGKLAVINENAA